VVMAIPRPVIAVAASAVAAGVLIYLRNKASQRSRDEQHERERQERKETTVAKEAKADEPKANVVNDPHAGDTAAAKELALFLAGDAWHDEVGWKTVWERENVSAPSAWLRAKGVDVLRRERHKLTEHPALLAGCRRRWIVVCRYAGMDVADAASVWHQTDAN
jgi:hypothetical protein